MLDSRVRWPAAGRYILAVSGGADSMVLLDVCARAAAERGFELVVAHFDHGLRDGSAADLAFVAAAAARYGLAFESHAAGLGHASEASARAARHLWLEQIRAIHIAAAVLTAHHQDDLLETSLLNLARGSGRLGLAPMQTSPTIVRPLLSLTRADLRAYAKLAKITWREDPTNADIGNARNLLRHLLLPAADVVWRSRYLELIEKVAELNTKIAQSISVILESAYIDEHTYSFPVETVRALTPPELEELLLAAARSLHPGIQLDRPLVADIAQFAQTGRSGKYRPLRQGLVVVIAPGFISLTTKSPH
jgi:tRNA(Ile)-lysidine synthetase-like protein